MKNLYFLLNLMLLCLLSSNAIARMDQSALSNGEIYQLTYLEREPGVDEYEVTLLVSARYIRLDETGEESGYIVYDDKEKVIYSVSHVDKSVLLINEHKFSSEDQPVNHKVEYLQLADAPKVSGKNIFNYRAYINNAGKEETCTELQIVEGLLPEVTNILHNYQKVISGQQVKMTDNTISEFQTACYFVDQIYNSGDYYAKGLPVQEWHSNERSKVLISYKKVNVIEDKFSIPEEYRQFSVDKDSKSFIQ